MTGADLISEAIVIWTGYRVTRWPSRDEARLEQAIGTEAAVGMLPTIRALEAEFYESDAWRTAADLPEMLERACSRFRELHPELSADAVEALGWCYTFDHR